MESLYCTTVQCLLGIGEVLFPSETKYTMTIIVSHKMYSTNSVKQIRYGKVLVLPYFLLGYYTHNIYSQYQCVCILPPNCRTNLSYVDIDNGKSRISYRILSHGQVHIQQIFLRKTTESHFTKTAIHYY